MLSKHALSQEMDLNRVYEEIDAGSQRSQNTRPLSSKTGALPATSKSLLHRVKVGPVWIAMLSDPVLLVNAALQYPKKRRTESLAPTLGAFIVSRTPRLVSCKVVVSCRLASAT